MTTFINAFNEALERAALARANEEQLSQLEYLLRRAPGARLPPTYKACQSCGSNRCRTVCYTPEGYPCTHCVAIMEGRPGPWFPLPTPIEWPSYRGLPIMGPWR